MIPEGTARTTFEEQAMPELERIYRSALYIVGSAAEAQRLVQESFAKAYRSWLQHQSGPKFRVWLFQHMSRALGYSSQTGAHPASTVGSVDASSACTGEPELQAFDEFGMPKAGPVSLSEDDVRKAISVVPEDCRLVVVLSLLERFTYHEISEITGYPVADVRSRLHLGRKVIRNRFDHAWRGKAHARRVSVEP